MRRYSIIHPLWLAFYSKDLYRDVARNWGNTALLYLFLLLAAAWVPVLIRFDAAVHKYVEETAPQILAQVPRITIHDGKASAVVAQPHCIAEPGADRCLMIIDTTGGTTVLDRRKARMLLTATSLVLARDETETRVYDLAGIENLVVDGELLGRWLRLASRFLALLAFPFLVTASFCFRVVQALLNAVAGLFFARLRGLDMSFGTLFSLAAVALTPVILVQTIIDVFGAEEPISRLGLFAIALGYVLFGVKASAEPAAAEPQLPGMRSPS